MSSPIGIFDSGYGGLTVMKEIVKKLPQYDYIYLGDNARSPYGPRSFETVYKYTLQAVEWLFHKHCQLVILACNTSSAKALRTIQQNDLIKLSPEKRVLGVIRPLTECLGKFTTSRHIGILGTAGTVASQSYPIEINKFFPDIAVTQEACPLWVPLVENGEYNSAGADYFIKKHLDNIFTIDPKIDTIVLGCTHYPLLLEKIQKFLPSNVNIISQGEIVSTSLADYLKRHTEMETKVSKNANLKFFTTDSTEIFDSHASIFFGKPVTSEKVRY
jgi:glutamate racemase